MASTRKPQSVYQHEPLVIPYKWNGEERQFGIKLDRLLDELYRKIGALEQRVKELEGSNNASV